MNTTTIDMGYRDVMEDPGGIQGFLREPETAPNTLNISRVVVQVSECKRLWQCRHYSETRNYGCIE
jgi:hypothetical protein